MNYESLRNSPAVLNFAGQGFGWAVKFRKSGWASLSTNQKRRARSALAIPIQPVTIVPTRARIRNPPPVNYRTKATPGQAGKSMTLTKSEYLCDVAGTTGATPKFDAWIINPRNVRAFTQTSMLAFSFNKYRFTKLAVRYSPACSFETNGRLALGWNDDASDPVPTNKSQLYSFGKHVETAAQTPVILEIPMDNKVRFMHDSASDDPKLVDLGMLVMTTFGFDSAVNVGELFLEFTVVFSDPTFNGPVTQFGTAVTAYEPNYGKYTAVQQTGYFTIHNPGKWLLVLQGAKSGFGRPSAQTPDATVTTTYCNGESAALATCVVEAQVSEQILSIPLGDTGVASWYLARL